METKKTAAKRAGATKRPAVAVSGVRAKPRIKYTEALADEICERLMNGETLTEICETDGMPKQSAVFRWLSTVPLFAEKYARARQVQADVFADEITALSNRPRLTEKIEKIEKGRICSECDRDVKWICGWKHSDDKTELCAGARAQVGFETKVTTTDLYERTRLQIDARKWFASKVAPKKYGERVEVEVADDRLDEVLNLIKNGPAKDNPETGAEAPAVREESA